MDEKTKYSMLVTFGPREADIWSETEELSGRGLLPQSRNEILRRGLYTCRFLCELDESSVLSLLLRELKSSTEDLHVGHISLATDLAFITYSIMIAKYGMSKAETFEIVPNNLAVLKQVLMEGKVKTAKEMSEIKKEIAEMATSVDIVFLKPLLDKGTGSRHKGANIA